MIEFIKEWVSGADTLDWVAAGVGAMGATLLLSALVAAFITMGLIIILPLAFIAALTVVFVGILK